MNYYSIKEIMEAAKKGEVSEIDAKHICKILEEIREKKNQKWLKKINEKTEKISKHWANMDNYNPF